MSQVPGESLRPLYEKLVLENVLSLSLSVELSLVEPFYLCEAAGAHSTATTKVHVSSFLAFHFMLQEQKPIDFSGT